MFQTAVRSENLHSAISVVSDDNVVVIQRRDVSGVEKFSAERATRAELVLVDAAGVVALYAMIARVGDDDVALGVARDAPRELELRPAAAFLANSVEQFVLAASSAESRCQS